MDFEKKIEAALESGKAVPQSKMTDSEKAKANKQADSYGNNAEIEMAWAIKSMKHAETYMNLLQSFDSTKLKLTKHDDDIYSHFRREFPDMKVDQISDDEMKSDTGKVKWRAFCNVYETTVKDFNYLTMIRLHSEGDYTEENTTVVPRIQFYAIEGARNREGHNASLKK